MAVAEKVAAEQSSAEMVGVFTATSFVLHDRETTTKVTRITSTEGNRLFIGYAKQIVYGLINWIRVYDDERGMVDK
ncbi:hypothetical protein GCM10027085_11570 [Spirosoma aerophilum]